MSKLIAASQAKSGKEQEACRNSWQSHAKTCARGGYTSARDKLRGAGRCVSFLFQGRIPGKGASGRSKKEKGKRKEKIIIVTYGTRDNSDTKFSHLEPCQCIPWSISECSPISTNYVRMSFLKILMLCNSDAPKKFHFTSLNVAN